MSIIEMRDVVKKYDNGTTALRGVSVSVQPGEFVYIVGPQEQESQHLLDLCTEKSKSKKEV